MELTFLHDHWDELKDSPTLRDIIDGVARGDLPHASEALFGVLSGR